MKIKKIFYLSNAIFPSEVSHTLSIHNLCLAFAKSGYEVKLFGLSSPSNNTEIADFYGQSNKSLEYDLIHIPNYLYKKLFRLLQLNRLLIALRSIKSIKKFAPDLIYSRLTILELLFLPSDIPIFYEMHSFGPQGKRFIYQIIFKILLKIKNFKKIIVTTSELKKNLEEIYPSIKIVLAPLSAEEPKKINKKDFLAIRRSLITETCYEYHLGYTGYLDDNDLRGMQTLIDIALEMPNFFIHVIGGSDEMRSLWQERAKSKGAENICFYGYKVPTSIPIYLNFFDLVLAPLKYRPIKRAPTGQNMSPLKLPQYMAYSKCIIASDIPSHSSILRNEYNALLVKYDDINDWVKKIHTAIDDPQLKSKLEENAYKTYLSSFDPRTRVETIMTR